MCCISWSEATFAGAEQGSVQLSQLRVLETCQCLPCRGRDPGSKEDVHQSLIWQWYHFGVGAPPILVYFSGDWDVHWGYDLDFDPWPFSLEPAWGPPACPWQVTEINPAQGWPTAYQSVFGLKDAGGGPKGSGGVRGESALRSR